MSKQVEPSVQLSWMLLGLLASDPGMLSQAEFLPINSLAPDARDLFHLLRSGRKDEFKKRLADLAGCDCYSPVHTLVQSLGTRFYTNEIDKAQTRSRFAFECDQATYVTAIASAVDEWKSFKRRFEGNSSGSKSRPAPGPRISRRQGDRVHPVDPGVLATPDNPPGSQPQERGPEAA